MYYVGVWGNVRVAYLCKTIWKLYVYNNKMLEVKILKNQSETSVNFYYYYLFSLKTFGKFHVYFVEITEKHKIILYFIKKKKTLRNAESSPEIQ